MTNDNPQAERGSIELFARTFDVSEAEAMDVLVAAKDEGFDIVTDLHTGRTLEPTGVWSKTLNIPVPPVDRAKQAEAEDRTFLWFLVASVAIAVVMVGGWWLFSVMSM